MKLKAWLDEKGVKYENIDVSADQEAAQKMIEKSGQMGVPQTEINGKMIVGFNQDAIEAELKKTESSGETAA
jgi:glutaredoxin